MMLLLTLRCACSGYQEDGKTYWPIDNLYSPILVRVQMIFRNTCSAMSCTSCSGTINTLWASTYVSEGLGLQSKHLRPTYWNKCWYIVEMRNKQTGEHHYSEVEACVSGVSSQIQSHDQVASPLHMFWSNSVLVACWRRSALQVRASRPESCSSKLCLNASVLGCGGCVPVQFDICLHQAESGHGHIVLTQGWILSGSWTRASLVQTTWLCILRSSTQKHNWTFTALEGSDVGSRNFHFFWRSQGSRMYERCLKLTRFWCRLWKFQPRFVSDHELQHVLIDTVNCRVITSSEWSILIARLDIMGILSLLRSFVCSCFTCHASVPPM